MTDTDKLRALHVWPQFVADHHADILTPRQIEGLYAVGPVACKAADELDRLRAELTQTQAKAEKLVEASVALQDDLLLRAQIAHDGTKIVNASNGRWLRFCEALTEWSAK